MIPSRIFVVIITISSIILFGFIPAGPQKDKFTIIIDAGHGGKDPGALGSNTREKDIALNTSLQLGRIIKENMPEVRILFTRTNDNFVELHKRAQIANAQKADLFISLHCNSVPNNTKVYGTETWVMGLHTSEKNLKIAQKENAVIKYENNYQEKYAGYDPNNPASHILFANYQSVYLDNSLVLAGLIEDQFKNRVSRYSRGVKQAGFLVLWQTFMPSVLIELGFLSNKKEESFLKSEYGQVLLASAIYRAVKNYKAKIEE